MGEPGLAYQQLGSWLLAELAQLPRKHLRLRTPRGRPTAATAGAGGNTPVRASGGQGSGGSGRGDLDAGGRGEGRREKGRG